MTHFSFTNEITNDDDDDDDDELADFSCSRMRMNGGLCMYSYVVRIRCLRLRLRSLRFIHAKNGECGFCVRVVGWTLRSRVVVVSWGGVGGGEGVDKVGKGG